MTASTTLERDTSAATPPAILSARDVALVYRTRTGSIAALKDLSLDVAAGEFVAILGPSGCGKSTFLKIVAGLIPASAGQVLLNGTATSKPRPDVGIVFQQPALMPWKTVLDNVLITPLCLGRDMRAAREAALALLRLVGLEAFAANYPFELSGGMQQRVGLARGLVHDPAVLLMDEPFAALDAMNREHMMIELQRLWLTTAKSVVFVTHSIPEAVFLADRVVVMSSRPGRVIDDIRVPFPRPRDLDTMVSAPFGELCNHLRRLFVAPADRAAPP